MTILKVPGSSRPLLLESIVWIEGEGNYSWLHFTSRPKLLVTQTLAWFAHQLPSFVRVHKSSLVNLMHVVSFKRINLRQAQVFLSNQLVLPVARRRVQPLAELLEKEPFVTYSLT